MKKRVYIYKESDAMKDLMSAKHDDDADLIDRLRFECMWRPFTDIDAEMPFNPNGETIKAFYIEHRIPLPLHVDMVGIKHGKVKKLYGFYADFHVAVNDAMLNEFPMD